VTDRRGSLELIGPVLALALAGIVGSTGFVDPALENEFKGALVSVANVDPRYVCGGNSGGGSSVRLQVQSLLQLSRWPAAIAGKNARKVSRSLALAFALRISLSTEASPVAWMCTSSAQIELGSLPSTARRRASSILVSAGGPGGCAVATTVEGDIADG